jgi:hypothetical protein
MIGMNAAERAYALARAQASAPDEMDVNLTDLLDRARAQLAAVEHGHPDRAFRLYLVGVILAGRYPMTMASADIDESVELLTRASRERSRDDPQLADYHFDLGAALALRGQTTERIADVMAAIVELGNGVELTPAGHPHYAKRLSALGLALAMVALSDTDTDMMNEALELHERAIAAAHPDDPRRAHYVNFFGQSLLLAADLFGDPQMRARGRRAFLDALRIAHPYDSMVPAYVRAIGQPGADSAWLRRGKGFARQRHP